MAHHAIVQAETNNVEAAAAGFQNNSDQASYFKQVFCNLINNWLADNLRWTFSYLQLFKTFLLEQNNQNLFLGRDSEYSIALLDSRSYSVTLSSIQVLSFDELNEIIEVKKFVQFALNCKAEFCLAHILFKSFSRIINLSIVF